MTHLAVPSDPSPPSLFGAGVAERRRLELVDEAFSSASSTLLERVPGPAPALAYDLGCAFGATTHMVSGRTGAEVTIGLDRSPEPIELARGWADAHVRFERHDVTSTPFPAGPDGLIYARLVLAHLPDPLATARLWATQLEPGGFLVLDEIEWIRTRHPALTEHLRIVHGLIEAGGAAMNAGPALAELGDVDGLARVHAEVAEVPVATGLAARMFALSLEITGERAIAAGLIDRPGLRDLRAVLGELSWSAETGETWGLHQSIHMRET
jgi:trans-aconitate 2-methyltransferase